MAKVKGTDKPNKELRFVKTNQTIKAGGECYGVSAPFIIPKLNFEMEVGFTFKESEDGMFAAYDDKNEKLFFRITSGFINVLLQNKQIS